MILGDEKKMSESVFQKEVERGFSFLIEEFRFKVVSSSMSEVRYESGKVWIEVTHDFRGGEIAIDFGRLQKKESFCFSLFLRSVNPKLEKSMGERMALRNPRIKWIVNDLAKALRSEGKGILLEEDKIFNDMKGVRWWDVEP